MQNKIGVICAMKEELHEVKKLMSNVYEKKIYDLVFYIGIINKTSCVVVASGIGKVNAARTTQVLIDNFELEYIINLGSAGAINDILNYGDIVIGESFCQRDFDASPLGFKVGEVPNISKTIKSDTALIKKCKDIASVILSDEYKAIVGKIASGDIFVTDVILKNKIINTFNADCVDMESAAIAQVCFLANIPFISIRSISDSPNGNNQIDFNNYLKLASSRCAEFVTRLL